MSKCPECKSEDTFVDDGPYLDGPDGMYLTHACDVCGCKWREDYVITPCDSEVVTHGKRHADE